MRESCIPLLDETPKITQIVISCNYQQLTRVFKMTSAFTSAQSLKKEYKEKGVVTVSDGNFVQTFAFLLQSFQDQRYDSKSLCKGTIFVPDVCYGWKLDLIQKTIKTAGEQFDECEEAAQKYIKEMIKYLQIQVTTSKPYVVVVQLTDSQSAQGN
ncbi:unnamed protein product (macronuclear) [Paramecium tetraurelia]|uniref:Uncharacterized protein n=1 Tax=Paramecium tetraurelia TaxID=5888 RepID=A0CAV5_PARTE|nr:uncharacterized protein GSPATT00036703001 [Paramecium tetraurelia]CAK67922.1 unnamed protein product [Paramecium tetraurelia]|eukprot:XP_001435319.1 hypothetical protein (macronuclear) [Paramecium tetraurelia strain d4-2]